MLLERLDGAGSAAADAPEDGVAELTAMGTGGNQELIEAAARLLARVGYDAMSMDDIAAQTLAGVVPDSRAIKKLSNEEILERLTAVRGVGPWTVEMLLMFRLGRADVLPIDDYGVRKGFALTYGLDELPSPKDLLAHGERWRPFRSVASWYLWRAAERASR